VLLNKINTTHLNATNYWTPLQLDEDENEEEEEEEVNKIYNEQKPKSNKWERRLTRKIEKRMVIDSGATSHFCSEEMDLPKEGESKQHSNNKKNIPTFPTTQQESKRSTCIPKSAAIINERKQIVRRRIHNNIPPGKRRSYNT
jgi:hypothetical protein